MSTTFQTASPTLQKLDPLKRVNYTFGLVLGVDEFLQSDTYFLAKHHVENRLLHGYGTVCGLDVTAQASPTLEVQVAPGWAINPRGQEIYVPQLMCVVVNDWIQANLTALKAIYSGPAPSTLNLCVVLCYRECKTDVVPIPGEPCQTQTTGTAPSRIADSFDLMLCLDPGASPPLASPPASAGTSGGLCVFQPAPEEDAVQAFASLMSQIQVSASPNLTLAQLEQLVRDLLQPLASPPWTSPPSTPPYYIAASNAAEYLRAAFRTWITEVRPFIGTAQGIGPCCPPPEKCVLLAEVALSLNANWAAVAAAIDDSRRPFLVPTGLLQEMAFQESSAVVAAAGYRTVAAGYFGVNGARIGPTYNNLTAATSPTAGEFVLSFAGYQVPTSVTTYIVKGTVTQNPEVTTQRATFQMVSFDPTGIRVRVLSTTGVALGSGSAFMVEISQIGGA